MEKYEKGNGNGRLSKSAEWDSTRIGKKAKRGGLPNDEIEKGMTSAHPGIGSQPWTFKGIRAEKKGRVKNKE